MQSRMSTGFRDRCGGSSVRFRYKCRDRLALVFFCTRYNGAMDDDDILAEEDIVTLTRSQWEDLMRSIQSLSLANAKLVETIAFLLKQNANRDSTVEGSAFVAVDGQDVDAIFTDKRLRELDPYDLGALRKIIEEGL